MAGMDFEDIRLALQQLWKGKWIIIFFTLAGIFSGMAYSERTPEEVYYRATSSVCVTYTSYQEQVLGGSLIINYADMVTSARVCENAAQKLADFGVDAESIQRRIGIRINNNSYVMHIDCTDVNPVLAVHMANAVAEAFVEQVSNISGNSSIQVLDLAVDTTVVSSSDSTEMILLAGGGAFMVVCAFIVLLSLTSTKVRSVTQCIDEENEILAIIPSVDGEGRAT